MENIKFDKQTLVQTVSTVILVCVGAAALIGLGLLFSIISFSDILGQVLLSLLTLFIAGLFLLNSINAVTQGNKVGIFAAFMILLSALLFLVLIWAGDYLGSFANVFNYIIVIVSMLSILLDVIIGHYIVLKTRFLAVQIFMYISLAYLETVLAFAILGNGALIALWQIFVAAIIVALTLYIVLKVKEKNLAQEHAEIKAEDGEYVTISKQEYENLKAELERLRELTAEKTPIIPIEDANATILNGNINFPATNGNINGNINGV